MHQAFVDEQVWNATIEARALKFEGESLDMDSPLLILGLFGNGVEQIPEGFYTYRMRWLLARRLTREGRGELAVRYFPKWLRADAVSYQKAMDAGRNLKASRRQRAEAWFEAAWLARTRGLELMGTECEPDNAATAGQYLASPIRKERLSGKYEVFRTGPDHQPKPVSLKVEVPVAPLEKQRLRSIPQPHTRRFHYRITAADHAWRAAKLLPNGSDELKDVLTSALRWLIRFEDEPALSKRFEDALDVRCPDWKTGSSGSAPWSGPRIKQLEAENEAKSAAVDKRREAAWAKEREAAGEQ